MVAPSLPPFFLAGKEAGQRPIVDHANRGNFLKTVTLQDRSRLGSEGLLQRSVAVSTRIACERQKESCPVWALGCWPRGRLADHVLCRREQQGASNQNTSARKRPHECRHHGSSPQGEKQRFPWSFWTCYIRVHKFIFWKIIFQCFKSHKKHSLMFYPSSSSYCHFWTPPHSFWCLFL